MRQAGALVLLLASFALTAALRTSSSANIFVASGAAPSVSRVGFVWLAAAEAAPAAAPTFRLYVSYFTPPALQDSGLHVELGSNSVALKLVRQGARQAELRHYEASSTAAARMLRLGRWSLPTTPANLLPKLQKHCIDHRLRSCRLARRLAGAHVAGVRLIPGAAAHLRGQSSESTIATLAAVAAAPGSAQQNLDWEQRWEPAAAGGAGSYKVLAVLPAGMSPLAVAWVATVCDGCAAARSGPFPGPLGAVQLGPWQDARQDNGSNGGAAVVFVLRPGLAATAAGATTADGAGADGAASAAGSPAAGRAGRRLLQTGGAPTPLPDCSLAVGSAPAETFAGCKSVSTSPAASYHVYCTLQPGTASNAGGTRWRGGVKVAASAVGGQWAGCAQRRRRCSRRRRRSRRLCARACVASLGPLPRLLPAVSLLTRLLIRPRGRCWLPVVAASGLHRSYLRLLPPPPASRRPPRTNVPLPPPAALASRSMQAP